jgi:ribosomal protein S18
VVKITLNLCIYYLHYFIDNINFIIYSEIIDYKNIVLLRNFINMQGKIIPRRLTKVTAKQHRLITKSI